MNKEDKIKEMFGQENPFRVPDKYFDNFADNMLGMLPDHPQAQPAARQPLRLRALFAKAKPYIYLAACFGGLYFGINVLKHQHEISDMAKNDNKVATTYVSEEEYINKVCEYAGIEKEQIYSYATGQDYEY
jgi:hypothetical protein